MIGLKLSKVVSREASTSSYPLCGRLNPYRCCLVPSLAVSGPCLTATPNTFVIEPHSLSPKSPSKPVVLRNCITPFLHNDVQWGQNLFAGQVIPKILYNNEISHHQVCHSASLECGYFFFLFDKEDDSGFTGTAFGVEQVRYTSASHGKDWMWLLISEVYVFNETRKLILAGEAQLKDLVSDGVT